MVLRGKVIDAKVMAARNGTQLTFLMRSQTSENRTSCNVHHMRRAETNKPSAAGQPKRRRSLRLSNAEFYEVEEFVD